MVDEGGKEGVRPGGREGGRSAEWGVGSRGSGGNRDGQ